MDPLELPISLEYSTLHLQQFCWLWLAQLGVLLVWQLAFLSLVLKQWLQVLRLAQEVKQSLALLLQLQALSVAVESQQVLALHLRQQLQVLGPVLVQVYHNKLVSHHSNLLFLQNKLHLLRLCMRFLLGLQQLVCLLLQMAWLRQKALQLAVESQQALALHLQQWSRDLVLAEGL